MKTQYMGLNDLSGSLVILEGIKDASFDEIVEISLDSGEKRMGRIIELNKEFAVVQVFEGTNGISLINTTTKLTGKSLMMPLSKEILGRTFDGIGRPIDGQGPRCARISAFVYTDGTFGNRRSDHTYQGSEASYLLR